MIKIINHTEDILDFAWELCQDDLFASYHRVSSIKELKDAIEKAIYRENERIIACYQNEVLCGICIYFWKSGENYAQTIQFLIKEDYNRTADLLLDYISRNLTGYELLIGVPATNINANQYFRSKNIICIESSIDTRMYILASPISQIHANIEKVAAHSFEEYATFHDKYAIPLEMYYSSKNLLKDFARFRIFAYRRNGEILGSIFVKASKHISEVFGLFLDEQVKNSGVEGLLISGMLIYLYSELGSVEEIVYFINEACGDELNIALAAGFEIKDHYRCYKCML